jgi:hypothetical protein
MSKEEIMALDCGPHRWNSCINSSASRCDTSDAGFEGTMDIDTPDPQTGKFEGWFTPKGSTAKQRITGKCSEQSPHMTLERKGSSGPKHKYKGDKSGDHVKGKHNTSSVAKGRKAPPDDEWIATKVT